MVVPGPRESLSAGGQSRVTPSHRLKGPGFSVAVYGIPSPVLGEKILNPDRELAGGPLEGSL